MAISIRASNKRIFQIMNVPSKVSPVFSNFMTVLLQLFYGARIVGKQSDLRKPNRKKPEQNIIHEIREITEEILLSTFAKVIWKISLLLAWILMSVI